MAGLWLDVRRSLATLDAVAADPSCLHDADVLPPLQYELHCAAEAVSGLTPPDGAESLHEELAAALLGLWLLVALTLAATLAASFRLRP